MIRISKEQLARNLNAAIDAEVGMHGLRILLYGWFAYRGYGRQYRHAVNARKFLYISEVSDLSDYAGYDLSSEKSA